MAIIQPIPAPLSESSNRRVLETNNLPHDTSTILISTPDGLTNEEASRRQAVYGLNEFTQQPDMLVLKFLSYFWGPIPWILTLIAAGLALLGYRADFVVMMVLLVCLCVVGFWASQQERHKIFKLKKKLARNVRVKRSGLWVDVLARYLVPGDTILLRTDDIVPADVTIVGSNPIQIDPLPIFGDEFHITACSGDVVYCGGLIIQGEAEALVFATGHSMFLGQIVQMILTTHNANYFFQHAVLKVQGKSISFRHHRSWED